MITEVDPNLIALRSDYNDCRKSLEKAYIVIDLLEKQINDLNATIAKQAIDLELALEDNAVLENALKFKPIYA